MRASALGHLELVELLLSRGAQARWGVCVCVGGVIISGGLEKRRAFALGISTFCYAIPQGEDDSTKVRPIHAAELGSERRPH